MQTCFGKPEPDAGRKIAFDNWLQTKYASYDWRASNDSHWVGHMCRENSVSSNHLSTVQPRLSAIPTLDNGVFIQSEEEHVLQREN